MAIKTPPLRVKGAFTLKAPWVSESGVIYECVAIRRFSELEMAGVDVYSAYYQPKGLDRATYEADRTQGASVVTLVAAAHLTIEVPDTYIDAYPQQDYVPYHTVVLSLSLGPVADANDLTFLMSQVAGAVSDVYGITPQVLQHTFPLDTVVTQAQHDALETARQAAVATRKTDRARVLELQAQLQATQEKLAGLEAYVLEHMS